MTIATEYQAGFLNWRPTTSSNSYDLAIVGLWSLFGLGLSAVLAMSGLAPNIGAVLMFAG